MALKSRQLAQLAEQVLAIQALRFAKLRPLAQSPLAASWLRAFFERAPLPLPREAFQKRKELGIGELPLWELPQLAEVAEPLTLGLGLVPSNSSNFACPATLICRPLGV